MYAGFAGRSGLAGLLGLKRRDRDEVKRGEVNRNDASRGATSRVEIGQYFGVRALRPPDPIHHFYPCGGSMQASFLTRSAALALLLAGVACAGNKSSDTEIGASQDTSAERISDSTNANQTESGMTDSSGQSTLGPEAEKTRPDQGQPVTSKGDTVNPSVDSSTTGR